MPDKDRTPPCAIAAAAEFFYEACGLYEDEDLDPDDHEEVVRRAFTSSRCDDFAAVVEAEYGCRPVTAGWTIPDWGFGHHTLLADESGRMFDVCGWTDERDIRSRYSIPRDIEIVFSEGPGPSTMVQPGDEEWELIRALAGSLPWPPFSDGGPKAAPRP